MRTGYVCGLSVLFILLRITLVAMAAAGSPTFPNPRIPPQSFTVPYRHSWAPLSPDPPEGVERGGEQRKPKEIYTAPKGKTILGWSWPTVLFFRDLPFLLWGRDHHTFNPGVPQGSQDLLSCPLISKHIPDRTNPRVLPLTRTSDLQNFPCLKSPGPAPGLCGTGTVARRCRTSSTCLPRPYGSSRKGRTRPQHVLTETNSTVQL